MLMYPTAKKFSVVSSTMLALFAGTSLAEAQVRHDYAPSEIQHQQQVQGVVQVLPVGGSFRFGGGRVVCFRPSTKIDRRDRIRFRDVPHYNVVTVTRDGAVRSVLLIRTDTGREVFRSHPYGTAFAAASARGDRECRMKTQELEKFLRGRPTPGIPTRLTQAEKVDPSTWHQGKAFAGGPRLALRHPQLLPGLLTEEFPSVLPIGYATRPMLASLGRDLTARWNPGAPAKGLILPATAPTGFANGLPIGWNGSTGSTSGQCFNYTINTPANNVSVTGFSSKDTASSTSEQIKASATVSVGIEGFKASDTFGFSDQWKASTNSTNQYYNLYTLWTLDTAVSQSDPLTSQGSDAGTSLSTLCGSQYMSAVTVGMVATLSINYGSSSSSTTTKISDKLSASFGLESISGAVSTAFSESSSSSYFEFSMIQYGGGTDASHDLNNAFQMVNSSGEAYYASCAAGNSDDCTTFSGNMGTGASNALNSIDKLVSNLSGSSNPDISFFETFPEGVAGANTPPLETTDVPVVVRDVILEFFGTSMALIDYLTLLNQVATLNNRVMQLNRLVSQPNFNPETLLDLVSYLDTLEDTYKGDRSTLLTNLENCLSATSTNVATMCGPIKLNTDTNAFEYYASGSTTPNFNAQQNTLALQYTAQVTETEDPDISNDVLYIDKLPSFAAAGSSIPIAGEAALIQFTDRTWLDGNTPSTGALVEILVLSSNEPISTNNVSTTVRTDTDPSPFNLWIVGNSGGGDELLNPGNLPNPNSFTSVTPCTPIFEDPCAINYEAPFDSRTRAIINQQIENFFTVN